MKRPSPSQRRLSRELLPALGNWPGKCEVCLQCREGWIFGRCSASRSQVDTVCVHAPSPSNRIANTSCSVSCSQNTCICDSAMQVGTSPTRNSNAQLRAARWPQSGLSYPALGNDPLARREIDQALHGRKLKTNWRPHHHGSLLMHTNRASILTNGYNQRLQANPTAPV